MFYLKDKPVITFTNDALVIKTETTEETVEVPVNEINMETSMVDLSEVGEDDNWGVDPTSIRGVEKSQAKMLGMEPSARVLKLQEVVFELQKRNEDLEYRVKDLQAALMDLTSQVEALRAAQGNKWFF